MAMLNRSLQAFAVAAALGFSACGAEPTNDAPTNDAPAVENPAGDGDASAPPIDDGGPAPEQTATAAEAGECDASLAERTLVQCKVCHSVEKDAANLTGPNLYGVFGREAAALDGFAYSPALRDSGAVWDEPTLDAFLESPMRAMPRNRMAFGGVRNADARAAIICYLKTLND
ncbi:MAG: c-type cytochrome [Pseudomonadota bacterium]